MKEFFKHYVAPIFLGLLLAFGIRVGIAYAEEPTVAPAPGVTNAAEYQAYLNANFSTVHTTLGDINVKDRITVKENQDQYKTYDLAVIIDYDVINQGINIGDVLGSTSYTEEQKTAFKESFESYQKQLAELTVATFPTKKVRGGFLASYYHYANLKRGYNEVTWFGWKNYDYGNNVIDFYKDTKVGQLHWYEFGNVPGAPLDSI